MQESLWASSPFKRQMRNWQTPTNLSETWCKCGRTRAMQTPQTSPRNNNNKINLSVQTANMQQVGDHPPSLQPPWRGENLAPKRNGPAERNMKKPHPLLHQWKIRWRNITTCYMTYVPVSPEFGEAFISDLETGNVNNYINSFVASSSKSSIASPVDGSTPTDITLQQKNHSAYAPQYPHPKKLSYWAVTSEKMVRGLLVCFVSYLSPACLKSLDVNFKQVFSLL